MRRKTILLIYLLISLSFVLAQNKILTLNEVILERNKFTPHGMQNLQWIPDEDAYSFIEQGEKSHFLVKAYPKSREKERILDFSSFYRGTGEPGETVSIPDITWLDKRTFFLWRRNTILKYDLRYQRLDLVTVIPEDAQNRDIEPGNFYVAFTRDNNLFIALDRNNVKQITNDLNREIINGQSVHRSEFGINKGTFWSPMGSFLAFYRKDETMVTDYPVVDLNTTPAALSNIKYPMAGQTSHEVTIGIYNLKSEKTTWLRTGEPRDQYLTNVTWGPYERYIYVAHLNRDQNHMRLIKYDAASGNQVKVLFEEKHAAFVEPENGPVFFGKNKDNFLWFSERDGWNHLYMYDSEGSLIKQLTQGQWAVTSFEGFDKKEQNIYFTSTQESPVERHFYSLELKSGKITKITNVEGTHNVLPNSKGSYFIDSYNSKTIPLNIDIVDKKGKKVKNVYTAENPAKDYRIGETRIFTLKAEDGTDLYCRMILPPDFNPAKRHPVLVYVYGGPHAQLVNNVWLGRLWLYYMAQEGFIVFTLDNRGSANRGLNFEQATFRKLGTVEIDDQMVGINYLKQQPYVDTHRIGVFGWSYGGFMATSLMVRKPEVFKAGVAGAPVIDWKYYEIMYTERYMDTPETNKEGYYESNTLNYVNNLKGDLLIIHGTSDNVVVWQNSLQFIKKAVDLNIQLEYFVYPGHLHGIRGNDSLHLYEKITKFFKEKL
ncbi:DPP IV N-terminal domain-containing protein [candidate division KSB1 bacterium]